MFIKKNSIWVFCIVISLVAIIGCSDGDSDPVGSSNHAPVIQSVTATPSVVKKYTYSLDIEECTTLSCVTTDLEMDSLEFTWSCSSGIFFEGIANGTTVHWGCALDGEYYVKVIASDGMAIEIDSVMVTVED